MKDLKLFGGFDFRRTDVQTDIGGCRVAIATEKVWYKNVSKCNDNNLISGISFINFKLSYLLGVAHRGHK